MKKLFLFSFLLLNINAFAQDFDNLMTKRYLTCNDVTLNCTSLFIDYYSENKLDTANYLLQYWQKKCGMNEAIQRAKILLSLKENNYNDSILDDRIFDYIYQYQYRVNSQNNHNHYSVKINNRGLYYHYYNRNFDYTLYEDFDDFLRDEFDKLKLLFDVKQIEYFWCEVFGKNNANAFLMLQNNNYNSIISTRYQNILVKNSKISKPHAAFITGIWVPLGKLNTLGLHPELGFQLGWKKRKMNYDFTIMLKFLRTPNYYLAYRKETNTFEKTNHFLGGYIGFDVGRDILVRKKHELQVVGGIAYDGFDVFEKDEKLGLKGVSLHSYNINAGLAYRFYIKDNFYLGLKAKYNVVDYTLNKVIDLTGHTVTIHFSIGGFGWLGW